MVNGNERPDTDLVYMFCIRRALIPAQTSWMRFEFFNCPRNPVRQFIKHNIREALPRITHPCSVGL